MNDYDKKFNKEIERILKELYSAPIDMGNTKLKRAIVETEKRFIDYLEEVNVVKRLKTADGNGKWAIQLERKGFEVFEKYNGWENYYKKVIRKNEKIDTAKGLATRFWWLPVVISIIALGFAFYTFYHNK